VQRRLGSGAAMTCGVIAGCVATRYNRSSSSRCPAMRLVIPAILLLVAAIHLLPVVGVAGPGRLATLYGIRIDDPSLEILMRHRAVLFGLIGVLLGAGAFVESLRGTALAAGLISTGSFVVLAMLVGGANEPVTRVVRIDVAAFVLLFAATGLHAWARRAL
jgi:hypothetical protein